MESLIQSSKVILVMGSGGVGKTTVAASLGVVAAQMGRKVLVMTIDPSLRLATSLGLSRDSKRVVPVDKDCLFAYLLDSESSFHSFVRESIDHPDRAKKLLSNKLFKQLSTTLSGSQEFTSLERLVFFHDSNDYDLIILDTPPTQHAIDFLGAPEKLYTLFDDSVSKWFLRPVQDQGPLRRMIHRGTERVFKTFEMATGAEFVNELREFFISVHGLRKSITRISRQAESILSDESTQFILVTSGNQSKDREVNHCVQQLKDRNLHLKAIVVNKCHPPWFNGEEMVFSDPEITELCKELSLEYMGKNSYLDQMQRTTPLVKVPEFKGDIVGLESLESFSRILLENWEKTLKQCHS